MFGSRSQKKGYTLVETIVSLAIFLITFDCLIAGCLAVRNAVLKQKEYVRFESVCLDINEYGNLYGRAWDEMYFKDSAVPQSKIARYDADFKLCNQQEKYQLTYYYSESNELILSVKNIQDDYVIIENLNYGGARYAP